MSLVIRCEECGAPLPKRLQYAPTPFCGGYECIRLDAHKVPWVNPELTDCNPDPINPHPFNKRAAA